MTLSIILTTRSTTGSGTSGVMALNHHQTPHQDRMTRSFCNLTLKLKVPNTTGDSRTATAREQTDVGKAHLVPEHCLFKNICTTWDPCW